MAVRSGVEQRWLIEGKKLPEREVPVAASSSMKIL
jgi:hypothetical protein